MYFKSLSSRFVLILLMVFATVVACAKDQEPAKPAAAEESSFEVWAVDQSSTGSYGTGGLIYIWDEADISENASEATPEIILSLIHI